MGKLFNLRNISVTNGLFILLPLLALPIAAAWAQTTLFEDALKLRAYIKTVTLDEPQLALYPESREETQEVIDILAKYDQGDNRLLADILADYADNPFLGGREGGQALIQMLITTQGELAANTDRSNLLPPLLSGRNFSIAGIADGFAQLLVSRTKAELNLAFFQRFYKQLDKHEELRLIFPATLQNLRTIHKKVYYIQNHLEALRQSFITDLRALPLNLQYLLLQENLIKDPAMQIVVQDALRLSQFLGRPNRSLHQYIDYLANESLLQRGEAYPAAAHADEQWKNSLQSLAGSFRLVDLIAKSFPPPSDDDWKDMFYELNDPYVLYLYLGLLYQGAEDVTVGLKDGALLTFAQALSGLDRGALTDKAQRMRAVVQRFADNVNLMEVQLDSLYSPRVKPAGEQFEIYQGLVLSTLNILETGLLFSRGVLPEQTEQPRLDSYFAFFRNLSELHLNMRQEHYLAGITNLVAVLELALRDDNIYKEVLRYGYFAAALAGVQNGQEANVVLDRFVLPTGSSAMKKNTAFSIALNAYTGLGYGWERLQALDRMGMLEESTVLAISAPVGLTLSKGLDKAGSLSLLLTAVDVGALTALRFDDPDTEDLPAFKLENVLAPGAYLVYGFPNNLPISLGFGRQFGPSLRRGADGLQLEERQGNRIGFFLNVDIPLANFYYK